MFSKPEIDDVGVELAKCLVPWLPYHDTKWPFSMCCFQRFSLIIAGSIEHERFVSTVVDDFLKDHGNLPWFTSDILWLQEGPDQSDQSKRKMTCEGQNLQQVKLLVLHSWSQTWIELEPFSSYRLDFSRESTPISLTSLWFSHKYGTSPFLVGKWSTSMPF